MLQQVNCPECDASFKVAQTHLGGKVLCPNCQSIVVVSGSMQNSPKPGEGEMEGASVGKPKRPRPAKRGLVVGSAFGFLMIVAAATLSGWYSLHLSKQHHFRKHYYEPALELLTKIKEAVEDAEAYSREELFAESVNETKRGVLLTTAAQLGDIDVVSPRIVKRRRRPQGRGETVELELLAKAKEFGTPRVITMFLEKTDGTFQLADLIVEARANEAP